MEADSRLPVTIIPWQNVPEGDWLALSEDETMVLAHAPTLEEVRAQVPSDAVFLRKNSKPWLLAAA